MPAASSVDRLPEEVRSALHLRLIESNFHGYDGLVDWLTGQGYQLSRSAVHRHGQKVQRRINRIQASTEAAQLIAEAAPDQQDARSGAVIALVQSELFEAMLNLEEADDADPQGRIKLLSQAARAIAEASRASVNQKRWEGEVRKEYEAKAQQAIEAARAAAREAGLDDDGADDVAAAIRIYLPDNQRGGAPA